MKTILLLLFFIFSISTINGQEIKLKSTIVSSAGSSPKTNILNVSKWRLGEIHLIVLKEDSYDPISEVNWKINSYPNPFTNFLNIDFQMAEKNEFIIQITDISGKEQWYKEAKTIYPNDVLRLDLSHMVPAYYLVSIIQKDKKTHYVFKVHKL